VWTGRGKGIGSSQCAARRRRPVTTIGPSPGRGRGAEQNRSRGARDAWSSRALYYETRSPIRCARRQPTCMCLRPSRWQTRPAGKPARRRRRSARTSKQAGKPAALASRNPAPAHGIRRRGVPSHAPQTGEHKQIKA